MNDVQDGLTNALVSNGDREEEIDEESNSAKLFERSRIRALADERESVQKKTFCKWINSHLAQVGCKIQDLYVDLRDGKMLIRLLEVLSGEKLPSPTKGKMRIHCLENVDKSLTFLNEQKVHLENVGAHDIVDGNARLTLGLVWTIILRFQIQDITVEPTGSSEVKSAKDALLLWCQMKTAGYTNVNVRNFTESWKNGLAFNALIHKHRPDLIDYETLKKNNPIHNLNNAFTVAEEKLGLTKLLDPEDVIETPDEKSIITYVVTYYHYFSKMKADSVQGRRIGKVVNQCLDDEQMIKQYEGFSSDLLEWVKVQINSLNNRDFANSLSGVQDQLSAFNNYRTVEKPVKFIEKGELEILLFKIQSQMRGNNLKPYQPPEGKLVADINKAWEHLEKAEHERELALREELIRQEKLEQLASRCDRKANMRELWLVENQRLVSQDNFGYDMAAVEAAIKKHEAIETDIQAYEERVQAVLAVAKELEFENYHDVERINNRKDNVVYLWQYLLELLQARRTRLDLSYQLQSTFQDMLYILDMMDEIKVRLQSEDYGKHLLGVEDLLKKHELIQSEIAVIGSRVENINVQKFIDGDPTNGYRPCDPEIVEDRTKHLLAAFEELKQLFEERQRKLLESRSMWQFESDLTEEGSWIKEKEQLMSSPDIGHDLTSVQLLLNKHKIDEDELRTHRLYLDSVLQSGLNLIQAGNVGAPRIQKKIDEVEKLWKDLDDLSNYRRLRLEEAHNFYQLFSDADDVDAWMMEMLRLISTDVVGKDEASIRTLIKKHKQLTSEIDSYEDVIQALLSQAKLLNNKDRDSPEVVERLSGTTERYEKLKQRAEMKKQGLLNALALHCLYDEGDGVEQWITEKEKLVHSMVATEDIEEIEILKARYDTFENEVDSNGDKVLMINQLAQQLLDDNHPDAQAVASKQKQLNDRWSGLIKLTEKKKENLQLACDVNQFHAECQETMTWIKDKEKLIESTDDLGDDLAGMIGLQRRLSGLSRDLGVIQAKIQTLNEKAEDLAVKKPNETAAMKKKLQAVAERWDHLKEMMESRDERLGEANEMQKFLHDLDHFQQWLSKTQALISSEDVPVDVASADQMLSDHQSVKDEIDAFVPQYKQIKEFGDKLVKDQEGDQYMFLRERLKALDGDWKDLVKIWESKRGRIIQNRNLQEFLREIKQVEVMLSTQDNFLSKDETATSPEQVEDMVKKHKMLESTIDANDEKIAYVLEMGQKLIDENHYLSGKIQDKVDTIKHRQLNNHRKSVEKLNRLKDQFDVLRLFQECDEMSDWIGEKLLLVQDETYRDAKNAHSKWVRHQAFEMEVKSNRSRLDGILSRAKQLISDKPDLKGTIQPRIEKLNEEWKLLEDQTKNKGEKLFESNKHIFYDQSCEEIDGWITEMESQIKTDEVHNLSIPINLIIRKQNILESQLKIKDHLLKELDKQEKVLDDLDAEEKNLLLAKKVSVENRFKALLVPLSQQQKDLELIKLRRQFALDAEEESNWINERLARLLIKDVGKDLAAVQSLKNKNKTLQTEVSNHEQRFHKVCNAGKELAESDPTKASEYVDIVTNLIGKWKDLQLALQEREDVLKDSELLQQYFCDVAEVDSWIAEQEFYLMSEDKARDETGAENIHKKHKDREQMIAEHEDVVRQLSAKSQQINPNMADSNQVLTKQRHLERNYSNLKQLASEKNQRLIEVIKLYKLHFEIEDLEQWIAQRETIASSQDYGQNFENVLLLQERFKNFEEETKTIGSDRVSIVNEICDGLIESGMSDAPVVAEWKDGINEAWTDLLELMETRNMALYASWQRFKLFNDCHDVLEQIKEKKLLSPGDEVEDTPQAISALQRRLANFENVLVLLGKQVQGIQETASKLIVCYSGEKAQEIQKREEEVVKAWEDIVSNLEMRKKLLANTFDMNNFFIMAKDLMVWMNEVHRQMDVTEKPRDVSGVELLLNNHTSLKADIDAKDENFTICANLGKDLFYKDHPQSSEIYKKLEQLAIQRGTLGEDWDKKWEYLQLIHEVYLFARDATVAESWIAAHEPHIFSKYYGETIDINEMLIRKHSALEKSMISQEERFGALTKLTALERLARESEKSSKPSQVEKYKKEFLPIKKDEMRKSIPIINPPEVEPSTTQRESVPTTTMIVEKSTKERKAPSPTTLEFDKSVTSPKLEATEKSGKSSSFKITRSSSSGKDKKPKDLDIKASSDSILEGTLNRKHEWESTVQKSTNRTWEKIFVVLTNQGTLAAFKDPKHAKSPTDTKVYFRHETPIDLLTEKARAIIATDYVKRPYVFRLKLESGAEYLFQCKDENEMTVWISEINRQANVGEEENKFLTLPPNPTSNKSELKKRSRFSFRKQKE